MEVRQDSNSNVLQQYTPQPSTVVPANIANDMSAMFSDAPARVPEYALNSPLSFPGYNVAVKTGTTDDTRDAWVIGYTPSIALGVWAGNNDNTPNDKNNRWFSSPRQCGMKQWCMCCQNIRRHISGKPTRFQIMCLQCCRAIGEFRMQMEISFRTTYFIGQIKIIRSALRPPILQATRNSLIGNMLSPHIILPHPELFTNPPIFVPLSAPTAVSFTTP